MSTRNKVKAAPLTSESLVTRISLFDFWHEIIPRREGLRRLATRGWSRDYVRRSKEPSLTGQITFNVSGWSFSRIRIFGPRHRCFVVTTTMHREGKDHSVFGPVFPEGRSRGVAFFCGMGSACYRFSRKIV